MNIKIKINLSKKSSILYFSQLWVLLEEVDLLSLLVSFVTCHSLPLLLLKMKLSIEYSQQYWNGSSPLLTSMQISWKLNRRYSLRLWKSTKMPWNNFCQLLPNLTICSTWEISLKSSMVFVWQTSKNYKQLSKHVVFGCIKLSESFLIDWSTRKIDLTYLILLKILSIEFGNLTLIKYLNILINPSMEKLTEKSLLSNKSEVYYGLMLWVLSVPEKSMNRSLIQADYKKLLKKL